MIKSDDQLPERRQRILFLPGFGIAGYKKDGWSDTIVYIESFKALTIINGRIPRPRYALMKC